MSTAVRRKRQPMLTAEQASQEHNETNATGNLHDQHKVLADETAESQVKEAKPNVETGVALYPAHMTIKRSLSPDRHINSASVEIDFGISGLSAEGIKTKGLGTLLLETEILESFFETQEPLPSPSLSGQFQPDDNNGAHAQPAVTARLLDIGRTKNNSYFINVKIGSKTAKLFGSARQLVRQLASIGQDLTPEAISEGLQLDFSCRAITKLSSDGRYLNVVELLPAK